MEDFSAMSVTDAHAVFSRLVEAPWARPEKSRYHRETGYPALGVKKSDGAEHPEL